MSYFARSLSTKPMAKGACGYPMNERLPDGLKRMPRQSTAWVGEECGASRRLERILEGPWAFLYSIAWRVKVAIFPATVAVSYEEKEIGACSLISALRVLDGICFVSMSLPFAGNGQF